MFGESGSRSIYTFLRIREISVDYSTSRSGVEGCFESFGRAYCRLELIGPVYNGRTGFVVNTCLFFRIRHVNLFGGLEGSEGTLELSTDRRETTDNNMIRTYVKLR